MPVQFRSICNSDSTPKGKDLESDEYVVFWVLFCCYVYLS